MNDILGGSVYDIKGKIARGQSDAAKNENIQLPTIIVEH